MLLDEFSCPSCASGCDLKDALSLNRCPGSLTEACVIKCPKCGTEFEITARQLEKPVEEPEKPAEEAPPPAEKPADETPAPATPPEEEKKESLEASVYKCLDCATERVIHKTAQPGNCLCCGSTDSCISGNTVEARLHDSLKQIAEGRDPEMALKDFLGE